MPSWSKFLRRMYLLVFYYIPRIFWWTARHFAQTKNDDWLWSARRSFVVSVVRAIFNDTTPKAMLAEQTSSLVMDHNSQSTMEVVTETFTVPSDNNLVQAMEKATYDLSESSFTPTQIDLAPWVKGEWVTDRLSAKDTRRESPEDVQKGGQPVTYLYLHGGQF